MRPPVVIARLVICERHLLFLAVPGADGAAVGGECRAELISVSHHLLLAPVDSLAESIGQLEESIVSDGRRFLPGVPAVHHQIDFDVFIQRIEEFQLALFDGHHVQFLILTRTDCQLNVSLVSQLELRYLALFLVVIRDKVVMAQLRGRDSFRDSPRRAPERILWFVHSCRAEFVLTAETMALMKRWPSLPPITLLICCFTASCVRYAVIPNLWFCLPLGASVFCTAILFTYSFLVSIISLLTRLSNFYTALNSIIRLLKKSRSASASSVESRA